MDQAMDQDMMAHGVIARASDMGTQDDNRKMRFT